MKTLPIDSTTHFIKNAALLFKTYCIFKMTPIEFMQMWLYCEVSKVQESPEGEKSDELTSHGRHGNSG